MKTLFVDCSMGAAGDMLTAALLEIVCRADEGAADNARIDKAKMAGFVERFNEIGIPGVEMKVAEDEKQGITGTHVHIYVNGEEEQEPGEHEHHHHDHDHEHDHEHHHHHHDHEHEHHHHHHSMADIEALVGALSIDEEVKADVMNVYKLIAAAESKVHGKPVSEVHFHEVGTMDAVADVTAVCMLIHEIAPEQIIATPVATGSGSVRCAHGILPVPAPATANILQGIPAYSGDIKGELCTPTGAALIKYFVNKYSQMPPMCTEAIGYGLGTKDFPKANCLRVFYGESVD